MAPRAAAQPSKSSGSRPREPAPRCRRAAEVRSGDRRPSLPSLRAPVVARAARSSRQRARVALGPPTWRRGRRAASVPRPPQLLVAATHVGPRDRAQLPRRVVDDEAERVVEPGACGRERDRRRVARLEPVPTSRSPCAAWRRPSLEPRRAAAALAGDDAPATAACLDLDDGARRRPPSDSTSPRTRRVSGPPLARRRGSRGRGATMQRGARRRRSAAPPGRSGPSRATACSMAPSAVDLDAHGVAALEEPRAGPSPRRRRSGVPVRIRSPGSSVHVSTRKSTISCGPKTRSDGRRVLAQLAVDVRGQPQRARVGDLVGGRDPRAPRAASCRSPWRASTAARGPGGRGRRGRRRPRSRRCVPPAPMTTASSPS